MIKQIQKIILNILVDYKYRRLRFKSVGDNAQFKALSSTFTYPENISIGNHVQIGPRANFDGAGGIMIGDGCIFAPDVKVFSRTHNFDLDLQAIPFDNVQLTSTVRIGRYAWLGTNVIVLPGVSIGEGAVIGAGAVVSRSIPAYAVAVGNPATVVRFRDEQRFLDLAKSDENFVYRKFGRKKILRRKKSRNEIMTN